MKTEQHPIDYAIYIDDQRSFIITVDHNQPDSPSVEQLIHPAADEHEEHNRPLGFQQRERIRELCNQVIVRLVNAHRLLIFGPSEAKYELRDTLRSTGDVVLEEREHLVTTDSMNEEAALRFSQSHLTYESNVTKLS